VVARALVVLGLVAIAACSSPTPSPSDPAPVASQVVLRPPQAREYPGDPWTFDGRRVPTDVLALTVGPEVCGYEDLLLLTMARTLGQPALTSDDARQYVRDPANQFGTIGRFEASVEEPPDVVFSGYRYGSMELWTSRQVGADAVFMERDGVWERWPRAREFFACAA
jgi:hypothetical protein